MCVCERERESVRVCVCLSDYAKKCNALSIKAVQREMLRELVKVMCSGLVGRIDVRGKQLVQEIMWLKLYSHTRVDNQIVLLSNEIPILSLVSCLMLYSTRVIVT
jgi:hypothetical protein